ncbi:unnamed protein product [Caenorhabditis bovis]|uniref:Transcription factor CBF/NF-Y/archaeal histone domain-containing protein n=1 Tax=Caenorhabditis bovis TaxID=2654633 RepID=A0A8S1ERT7_9PELO|nr:unnamed protein product [Caenorhabditis bovis]
MAHKRKGKKDADITRMTDEEIRIMEEHVEEILSSQLPMGRVKKVCRLDPDIEMINGEALKLMTKAAELFIVELGRAANTNAAMEKRKTVQLKDINNCIKKQWTFAFLEDALDDWPKPETKKRKAQGETTVLEETLNGDGEEEDAEDVVEDSQENVVDDSQEPDETVPDSQEGAEQPEKVDRFAGQF